MDLRPRSAQKRRQHAAASDESDGGSEDDWTAPSEVSRSASSGTSSQVDTWSDNRNHVNLLSALSEEVFPPPLERTQFNSWESFHAYLNDYSAQTYQSFRVRTNNKAEERNKKIKKANSRAPLIPLEWDMYNKTLVCTHAGTFKSRGKGKRARQESRSTKCGAQINACVRVINNKPDDPVFSLCVTTAKLANNHRLDRTTHQQYASVRTALPTRVVDTVDILRKAGAKKKRILEYILENADNSVEIRDVHNLVRKLKEKETAGTTSKVRLKTWLTEFREEPGNIGRIFVYKRGDKKVATCIILQTKRMREMFYRFPEVMLIDATHGTNSSKYKIFSFMVHDAFGTGQFVQHAVLQNERAATLMTSIEEFKKNTPSWTKLQCVVIDKDFTEMAVLKAAFPGVRILLCQFHVLKYLREQLASSEYGLSPWQKAQLRSVISLMLYATTEREFFKHRDYMRHVLSIGMESARRETSEDTGGSSARLTFTPGVDGNQPSGDGNLSISNHLDGPADDAETHPFEAYFHKNWDNCKEMWAAYERQSAVTMGNNTNNRLESSWKHLKDTMNSFMGLDECVASLICYQLRTERAFDAKATKIGVVHNPKYDREMSLVANLVSRHACDLIFDQYVYAMGGTAQYNFYEAVSGIIFIKNETEVDEALDEPSVEYSVNKKNWECSCLFMSTRRLPCRHVFYIRKAMHMEVVIPTQLLPSRGLLSSLKSEVPVDELPSAPSGVGQIVHYKEKPWDSNRKFNEAQQVATKISETMSEMGMPQYRAALSALQEVARRFKHGECEALVDQIVSTVGGSPESPIPLLVNGEEAEIDGVCSRAGQKPNSTLGTTLEPTVEVTQATMVAEDAVDEVSLQEPEGVNDAEYDPNVMNEDAEQETVSTMEAPVQMGTEPIQMGTQTVHTDTHTGTEPVQMGTEPVSMGSHSATEPVQMVAGPVQTDPEPSGTTPLPVQILQALRSDAENDDFDFESPPRSRGRPKAKASVVKAKQNRAVAMAHEDSTLHSMNLSLATVAEIVAGDPTYSSDAPTLKRFKLFVFEKKTKAPVARERSKLPASKTIIDAHDLIRVLPKDMLNKCGAKVVALQKKTKGLAERDITVEIPGLGVLSTATLAIMTKYHRAIAAVRQVEKALAWIPTVNLALSVGPHFQAEEDPSLTDKIESLRLLSSEMEVLDLAATGCLSEDTMTTLMTKLFGSDPTRILGSANLVSVTLGSDVVVDRDGLEALFLGASMERVMIPVNCNGNHWSSIMVDFIEHKLFYYDPMDSSYKVGLRAATQAIKSMVPAMQSRTGRIQPYTSTLGIQTDSYNCGVYILVTFEIFSGAESPEFVDKKTLQHLRYRYLSMCT